MSSPRGELLFDHEAEWHLASINFAMQNVATVTTADAVIKALG